MLDNEQKAMEAKAMVESQEFHVASIKKGEKKKKNKTRKNKTLL